MAQQAVFTVLERVSSISIEEAKFLLGVSDKVESAKLQLMQMQAFLKDVDDKMLNGSAVARVLVFQVKGVAFEVEDIMDSANILMKKNDPKTSTKGAICKHACFPVHLTHLHNLGARIDSANAKMAKIFDDFQKLNIAAAAISVPPQDYITKDDTIQQRRSVHPDFDEHVNVIGFDEQIKQIKDDLLDSTNKNLTVVSIVGLSGAGKSTMAKKVYGLAAVHFEVHAWVTVSQRPVPRDLLTEMVNRLIPSDVLEKMIKRITMKRDAKELKELMQRQMMNLLHEFLREKRYLVVLDDVWHEDAWDTIRPTFPDDKNSSRIVLTTRNQAVAQHPNARKKTYVPKHLDQEESVQLLLSIALPEYSLVDRGNNNAAARVQNLAELKRLGEDIAVKCGGLPLAIVVVGGYLLRNLDVAEWKRLTTSVDWHDMIGDILNLSLNDMPSHLKSCFMYSTAFPADSLIDVRVLARLWVAEGFVPHVRGHTREEVAIKYVDELVQRCMIQVEERACSGRITVVKVHDILHSWGISQARMEGFMKDCQNAEDIKATYKDELVGAYRMALNGFMLETEFFASMRELRSLLAFGFHTARVGKSLQDLHHLRVLYLHSSGPDVFLPREIGRMRYLRYLGFGGNCTYHLPYSVGDLLSLETVDAAGGGGRIHNIPGSLWKIPALRQVHISRARGWSVPRISLQSKVHAIVLSSIADLLHTRSAETNYILEAWRIMEATKRQLSGDKNPNLSCCFGMTYDMKATGNHMDIVGKCEADLRFPNDFPDFEKMDNVTVLKIRCAKLLNIDQKMQELSRMRFLMVLEIGEQSYTEEVLDCPGGSFKCLVQLLLYDLALKDWKLGSESMICLRELTVCKCPNLSYLPEELLRLPHLSKLDLIQMPISCYQQNTVASELMKKGCLVFKSTEVKDFQHLDLPIPEFTLRRFRE